MQRIYLPSINRKFFLYIRPKSIVNTLSRYSNLRSKFTNLTQAGLDLLSKFLTYDPAKRITAEQALKHPYFTEAPAPKDPALFPTWPSKGSGHK